MTVLNNEQNHEIKPCESYCCQNILCAVTYDEADRTKHGMDCPILAGHRPKQIAYIVNENFSQTHELISCWFCNGEKMNYDVECQNYCCSKERYCIDMESGTIHLLNCRVLKDVPIYSVMFRKKTYDILRGKTKDYSYCCKVCLDHLLRLN